MRIINKNECSYLNDYIIDSEGNIVNPGVEVVRGINNLDKLFQALKYLDDQPAYSPKPSLDGFKPMTANSYAVKNTKTKTLDKKAKEAAKILKELEHAEVVDITNEALKKWTPVLDFFSSNYIVDKGESEPVYPFTCAIITPVGTDFSTSDVVSIVSCGVEHHIGD